MAPLAFVFDLDNIFYRDEAGIRFFYGPGNEGHDFLRTKCVESAGSVAILKSLPLLGWQQPQGRMRRRELIGRFPPRFLVHLGVISIGLKLYNLAHDGAIHHQD